METLELDHLLSIFHFLLSFLVLGAQVLFGEMAFTVADYLFSKLVELGTVHVFGNGPGITHTRNELAMLIELDSSFKTAIYGNGLYYQDISVTYPTVVGLPVFAVSSDADDLSACCIHGARYIGDGPAVYVVEQISAQFNQYVVISILHSLF